MIQGLNSLFLLRTQIFGSFSCPFFFFFLRYFSYFPPQADSRPVYGLLLPSEANVVLNYTESLYASRLKRPVHSFFCSPYDHYLYSPPNRKSPVFGHMPYIQNYS